MNTIKEIAVVLPAYNEALTIAETLEDFHANLPEGFLVVVDNNSSDDTARIARKTLDRLGAKGIVLTEPKQGKGFAVRRAFKTIDADIYIMSDADFTYPAEQAGQLIQCMNERNADMVVGDRHSSGSYLQENTRRLHNFGNGLVTWLVNTLFGAELNDIMSGLRVLTRRFVKNYPILVNGFELETDMTLHALDKRMTIVEIPIEIRDRPEGSESKLKTVPDGARVLFVILQLLRYYRPMFFFGATALILFIAGLAAGTLPVLDYYFEGFVHHVPLAILATGLELSALISLSIGLILDSIGHSAKMQFEKDL
ncbi:glycosyltransferase family 2 protein [Luminiphilus syltensis]|nr:glycosyltransferase family 2 protein [Luminiphilus syltensis]